jgi:hypothetical protein
MSIENHGRVISTGKAPDSSARALLQSHQQTYLVVKQEEMTKEMFDFAIQYLFHTSKGSLTCRRILRHEADGITSPPKEVVLLTLSLLDIHRPLPCLNPRTSSPMASTLTTRPPKTSTSHVN